MKEVNDANQSFFSPEAAFIGVFFFPQQICQLYWLYRLYRTKGDKPAEKAELDQMVDYVPYYALGNFCIAGKGKGDFVQTRAMCDE